jgi:hypothetical protein
MFERFAAIREASARHYQRRESTPLTSKPDEDIGEGMIQELESGAHVAHLIDQLSKHDRVELTGAIFFGRDCVAWDEGDPFRELAAYTRDNAGLCNHAGHAGYLSQKPIHKYLQDAEDKLNGAWDERSLAGVDRDELEQ